MYRGSNVGPGSRILEDVGVTRRRLLLGGLGGCLAGAAAGAGMLTDLLPGGAPLRRTLGLTGPDGTVPDVPPGPVTVERVHSAARGREVELITMRPDGTGSTPLPVCLALHGRGDTARDLIDLGLPRFLTAAIRAGVPPFALAAVDCGDSYFVPRDGDDPLRMLTDELPHWLGAPPSAAFGISMGGFGALRLARRRTLRAVVLASPALFRTWPEARSRNAFADERQWADHEPLRHLTEIAGTPLGVWCGTEDPFVEAARELIAGTRPEVAAISRGAHDTGYWRRVLPDMLRFAGRRSRM